MIRSLISTRSALTNQFPIDTTSYPLSGRLCHIPSVDSD